MGKDQLPFAGGAAFLLSPVRSECFGSLVKPLWVACDVFNVTCGKILRRIWRSFPEGLQKPGLDQDRDIVITKAKNERCLLHVEPGRKSRKG